MRLGNDPAHRRRGQWGSIVNRDAIPAFSAAGWFGVVVTRTSSELPPARTRAQGVDNRESASR